MARKNLTKAAVEDFSYDPDGPSRQVLWDGKVSGFGCRVTPQGGKQYVLSYRFNGRPRLMSLGPLDHFQTLDRAREKAAELLHGLRHEGIDPLSTRERLSGAETIEVLWETYRVNHLAKLSLNVRTNLLGSDPDNKPGGWWKNHIASHIKHLKPQQVTASDLVRLHDAVTRDSGPVVANRCITRLAHFFDWLAERDEHLFATEWKNPARRVTVHKEQPRDHFLTVEQMRVLFNALDTHESPYFRGFIGMLLFTAARKNEVLNLKWSDVNLVARTARVARTKNGKPLTMPLPEPAVRLLESLPAVAGNDYVFPAPIKRGAPMSSPQDAYKALLKRLNLPVETTFHDLRRSVGCSLAAAGHSETIISALLNNTATMAAKHYIHLAGETKRKIANAHAAMFLPNSPQEKDGVIASLPGSQS
jgi:integrase